MIDQDGHIYFQELTQKTNNAFSTYVKEFAESTQYLMHPGYVADYVEDIEWLEIALATHSVCYYFSFDKINADFEKEQVPAHIIPIFHRLIQKKNEGRR